MKNYSVPCAVIRGGTTKGIYINTKHLPEDKQLRDSIILGLFGSPDHRQINGLGGGDPLTSKVALVSASLEPDIDLYYQSGEVGIDEALINYSTMCGNLAAGVGLFAIAEGLLKPEYPNTSCTIKNLNTGKLIKAQIPLSSDGTFVIHEDCSQIDGVGSSGVEVKLSFEDPNGSITGKLLPTGTPKNNILVDNTVFECSVVDCGTVYAIFQAHLFGLSASEPAESLDANIRFKQLIEILRNKVAELISNGIGRNFTPKQIKIAICSLSSPEEGNFYINARVINRYKTHKAFPVTGAICFSGACVLTGTILNTLSCLDNREHAVSISHPEGVIVALSQCKVENGCIGIDHTRVVRSARIIMRGIGEVII